MRYEVQVCDLCKKELKRDYNTMVEWTDVKIVTKPSEGGYAIVTMCPPCKKDWDALLADHNGQIKAFLGKFGFKDRQ